MKRLLERARRELGEFIEQRRDLALLVRCDDGDAAILLRLLGDLDEQNDTDVFFAFGGTFHDPISYAQSVIEELAAEHERAVAALSPDEVAALGPFPAELADASIPPSDRIRRAITYGKSLLPPEPGHRVVFTLAPQSILDPVAWISWIASLASTSRVEPWMERTRLVLRDAPLYGDDPVLRAGLLRIRTASFSFGPEAIRASLDEDVGDEELPIEERMQALLTVALLDVGHNRTDDSLPKLSTLLGHYQQTDNAGLQTVVMNALGDVHRRNALLDDARHWYECAIETAARCNNAIILATVIRNLGEVAFEQARYGESEHFFTELDQLAGAALDADTKAYALEWMGVSQLAQRKLPAALASWEIAAELERTLAMNHRLRSTLGRMREVYRQTGMADRLARVEQELLVLPEA